MCGRIIRTSPREAIARELGVTRFAEVDWHPRYNVAPSQIVETIISINGEKRLGPMSLGFRPAHGQGAEARAHHARVETLLPPHRCSGTPSDAIGASSWPMVLRGYGSRGPFERPFTRRPVRGYAPGVAPPVQICLHRNAFMCQGLPIERPPTCPRPIVRGEVA